MTRDDVLAVLARRNDAISRRDRQAFGAAYAETAELKSPLAGTVRGRDAVVTASWAFLAAFPDAVFVYADPVVEGDEVAVFAEASGTDVGGIMGLPPSGRPFRFPVAFGLTIRDHLIVREQRIYDFTGLLIQIGALKAKPA